MSSHELLPNVQPIPMSQTSLSQHDINTITLTPDVKRGNNHRRRQKKNSKHKIRNWETETNSSINSFQMSEEDEGSDLENRTPLREESTRKTLQALNVLENSSKALFYKKSNLENMQLPDAGKLAHEKIKTSAVIKQIIDEDAAKATTRRYDEIIYTDDYIVPVEHPEGPEQVIEEARQAKLAMAPMIIIPPKPEAGIGVPDLFSILPQDSLSYSTPTFRNHHPIRPKNELISCTIEESAFALARCQNLWENKIKAGL